MLELNNRILKIIIEDSIAYVAAGNILQVINIKEPTGPQIIKGKQVSDTIYDFVLNDRYILLAAGNSGLIILDKASLKEISRWDSISDIGYRVDISGNYAFLAEHTGSLQIFDFSDPTNIEQVCNIDVAQYIIDIKIHSNFCYISGFYEGLFIYDISNLKAPLRISSYFTNGPLERFIISNDRIFLADYFEITVLNISSPSSLKEEGYFVLKEIVLAPILSNNLLFVNNYEEGIRVLDISDLNNIKEVGFYKIKEPLSTITIKDGIIYAGFGRKLVILKFSKPEKIPAQAPKKRLTRAKFEEERLKEFMPSFGCCKIPILTVGGCLGAFPGGKPDTSEVSIFHSGREWIYKVYFLNSNGDTTDSQDVVLRVPGGGFFGQIKINWLYKKQKRKETTGVIEDSKRIWIHPPREGDFEFTELAPYPEIQKPFKDGKKWKSILKIGEGWGEWSGLTINHSYEIITQADITTPMGNFSNCWQVAAKGESKMGVFTLNLYFHPEYGFVLMEYRKPSGESVVLELVNVKFGE
ncbi:MAG: hypothetical protein ABIL86_04820 [candidate division WOR-3 bacterium]